MIPNNSLSHWAGILSAASAASFASKNLTCSTESPLISSVSPDCTISTFLSICLTITSICLSLITTPCRRYTSWTSLVIYFDNWTTPNKRKISCGFDGPSEITSPFSTVSPSKIFIWRYLCIKASYGSEPSFGVIIKRFLPLVSLPKLTTPLISARMDDSLGLRASNKSATLGRPPVISRVFDDSCGIRAKTSPISRLSPFLIFRRALGGKKTWIGVSVPGNITLSPFSSSNCTIGRTSLPEEGRSLGSIIWIFERPVNSSVWVLTVIPSSIPTNWALPPVSVIIGCVCGSHFATIAPAATLSPSLAEITAP